MMSISEYMEGEVKSRSPFIITGVLKPRYLRDDLVLSRWVKDWRRNSKSQIIRMIYNVLTME